MSHAVQCVVDGSEEPCEVELAGLVARDIHRAPALLKQLAAAEVTGTEATGIGEPLIWMRLMMAWAYEHRDRLADPLSAVEEIYAGFGWPTEIAHLVRYMPSDGTLGLRPVDAQQELMRLWEAYVNGAFGAPRD